MRFTILLSCCVPTDSHLSSLFCYSYVIRAFLSLYILTLHFCIFTMCLLVAQTMFPEIFGAELLKIEYTFQL